jgi:heavy metal sensor kinase
MLSSIKVKIILYYITVLFVILSLLGTFLYFSLNNIVYKSLDAGLLARAKAIASLIDVDRKETDFNLSDEIIGEYRSPRSGSFFQVRRRDGSTMAKSASLGGTELPLPVDASHSYTTTVRLNGRPVRLINFPYVSAGEGWNTGHKSVQGFVVQCAEDMEGQLDLLEDFRSVLVGGVLSVMLLSALGGFVIAKKALTPVLDISQTIDRISEQDLTRRVSLQGVPRELKILAGSFNRTFDRMEEAFNRQKRFAADASHELRTPLSVILSQSEIALRKERTAAEYKSSLDAVMRAARTMSSTVRKLLTLTRLSADRVELRFEPIHVREVMHDVEKLLGPLAGQKGIVLELSDIPASLTVRGDREHLLELFTNLLDNSIKYNVPQGRVHISSWKDPEFIVTEIRDTGIGIPAHALEKVFDRFYRVDHSRSKEIEGSGLGLSICKEIAGLHGGQIEIRSREGEGTVVTVYLKEEVSGRSSGQGKPEDV